MWRGSKSTYQSLLGHPGVSWEQIQLSSVQTTQGRAIAIVYKMKVNPTPLWILLSVQGSKSPFVLLVPISDSSHPNLRQNNGTGAGNVWVHPLPPLPFSAWPWVGWFTSWGPGPHFMDFDYTQNDFCWKMGNFFSLSSFLGESQIWIFPRTTEHRTCAHRCGTLHVSMGNEAPCRVDQANRPLY